MPSVLLLGLASPLRKFMRLGKSPGNLILPNIYLERSLEHQSLGRTLAFPDPIAQVWTSSRGHWEIGRCKKGVFRCCCPGGGRVGIATQFSLLT